MDHSLESAELAENDVKENFYEKVFPDSSKFEIGYKLGSDFWNRKSVITSGYYSSLAIYLSGLTAFILLLLKPVLKKLLDVSISRPLLAW